MRLLRLAVLALLPLLAAPALALEAPTGKAVKHEGLFATFPTGLRLAVYELPGSPRASVGVTWLAGSIDDPPGKEGLAHLVEHLAFRCRVEGGTVWQWLQQEGALFNAFTTHDATTYFESGKPDQLPMLAAVEAARLKDPLRGVTQADLDAEKEVVVSELREYEQFAPEIAALEALDARLYGAGHPYARSIGGTPETVRSITLADVQAYAAKLYRPERAIVVVAGPAGAKTAAEQVLAQLGEAATGPAPAAGAAAPPPVKPAERTLPPTPPDPPSDLLTIKGAVPRPVLLVGFTVPGEAAEGGPLAFGAANVLRSVLQQRLWGEGDWTKIASIDVGVQSHDGPARVVARIELNDAKVAKDVLGALRDNLFRPVDERDSDARARARIDQRSRDTLLMETYLSLERLDVGDLAEFIRATGRQDAIAGRQKQVLQLNQTTDKFWHTHLKRARSAAVLLVPDPARPPGLDASGGLAARGEQHGDRDVPFTPNQPVTQLARPPGLDQAFRAKLENGLTVVLVRRPQLPIFEAQLLVPTDVPANVVLPQFAQGFAGTSAGNRWSHSARLGSQGYTRAGLESQLMVRRGSSATLSELLEDLARLPGDFEYSRTRLELERDFTAGELAAQQRNTEVAAQRAFLAALYPDHAYGRAPTPEDAKAITLDEARGWVEAQLRPDQAVLVVAGDLEPGQALVEKIESIFSGWKAGRAAPRQAPAAPLPAEPRTLLVDRPGAKLTRLLVGLRLPAREAVDPAALDAVAKRLGQTLQQTLRVEAGATYGVQAAVLDQPLGGALYVQTSVDAPAAAEALQRLLAGVETLATTPLPAPAAARVRWLVARDFALRFDSVSLVAGQVQYAALRGLPADHWEKYAAAVASLTPERIKAAAKQLLGREIILVVGDAKAIGPRLKDAGFDYELVPAPAAAAPKK